MTHDPFIIAGIAVAIIEAAFVIIVAIAVALNFWWDWHG
jgi:hypothetical protein